MKRKKKEKKKKKKKDEPIRYFGSSKLVMCRTRYEIRWDSGRSPAGNPAARACVYLAAQVVCTWILILLGLEDRVPHSCVTAVYGDCGVAGACGDCQHCYRALRRLWGPLRKPARFILASRLRWRALAYKRWREDCHERELRRLRLWGSSWYPHIPWVFSHQWVSRTGRAPLCTGSDI